MMRIAAILLIIVAAVAALIFFPTTPAPAYSLSRIDVADTEEERSQGLSNREVPADYGMLFVFDVEGSYGFWMKETLVPLDLIWLSGDGTILGITANVGPETYPQIFYPPVPVRYVLEVRGGESAVQGWEPGTVLSLPIAQ